MTENEQNVYVKRKSKKFAVSELAVLGVMTALVIVVQVAAAILLHMTGIAIIPGAMQFAIAFVSSAVLFVALKKLPKNWTLVIITTVYGLVSMLGMGPYLGLSVIIGGLIAELVIRVSGGYNSPYALIAALVVFRFTVSVGTSLSKIVIDATELNIVWYLILIKIAGAVLGALAGGLSGKSLYGRLSRSGVIK